MIRVGEFSAQPFEPRKKFWLEQLKLNLTWVDFAAEQLADPASMLKSDAIDGVLLPPEHSPALLAASARIPEDVREAGLVCSLVRENGKLWMRADLQKALHELILQRASQLDTHSIVYVTGSDAQARLCIVIAVKMGFQKIVLISEHEEQSEALVESLKKLFFGLDFRLLKETELTLQPNNGSLLLNTLTSETGPIVVEDLTYLNFLRKDGLVVDLPLVCGENSLMDEAKHVGIRNLSGIEIWGLRDYLFLRALKVEALPSEEDYQKSWSLYLSQEKRT